MLKPRVIPCLLVHQHGLVKTTQFKQPKYVGDPLNAVKIFNEKKVDELMVLDIDASRDGHAPDFDMIGALARECRMPLCYGGGIKTLEQIKHIISLGVEKVAVSSAFIEDPKLISTAAHCVGSQSLVVVLDVKKSSFLRKHGVKTHNGQCSTGLDVVALAKKAEALGAGEVVINAIDQDGMMQGYDHVLLQLVKQHISIPLTALGGAGSLADIKALFDACGLIGAGVGSLFVFKGKYRAVLINYPDAVEKEQFTWLHEECVL